MATYAVADLHGNLNLYKQIKAFLKPEDKVYFLGDAGDRGPEPWETIKAIAKDPQFIYLRGNHEEMLVDAAYEYYANQCCDYWCQMLFQNGGGDTLMQLGAEQNIVGWCDYLRKLPLVETYTQVSLPGWKTPKFAIRQTPGTGSTFMANGQKAQIM